VGVRRLRAVGHGLARLAPAPLRVPRRQEAPEVRLRGGRAGDRTRAPARPPHEALAPHVHRHAVSPIRGYVFDAYGTLFDVHSVIEAGRAITADPMTLSALWRQKQLESTWL